VGALIVCLNPPGEESGPERVRLVRRATAVYLVMTGPWQRWCRITLVGRDGRVLGVRTLGGPGPPDLEAVDAVARTILSATRQGARSIVTDVSPRLGELLHMVGLWIEVEGETEGREKPFRVDESEEEAHRRDLSS
jgi:hypothetical protein